MSSNINPLGNDFNSPQVCKDLRNRINSILDTIPFFVKIIVFSTFIFYFLNLISMYPACFLADIPYFTIINLQIWRLVTTPFITTGFISIVFSLIFWYPNAKKLEQEKGTIKFMLHFFINSIFIQIMYCMVMLFIYLITQNLMMLKTKLTINGVRNEGLWPILICDFTLLCLSNPEANMKLFFSPINIKAKYYPLVLLVIFTLINNFHINVELFCGIALGAIYYYYFQFKTEINNTILKVENNFLCKWMANKKGFISISNTSSPDPDIPVNLVNSSNSNNFSSFKGKGITLGTSDVKSQKENVDYANLTSKTNEDLGTNESKLELNNNNIQV